MPKKKRTITVKKKTYKKKGVKPTFKNESVMTGSSNKTVTPKVEVVTLKPSDDGGVVAPVWDGTDAPNEFGVKALTSVDGQSRGVGINPADVMKDLEGQVISTKVKSDVEE
jgi:hypothetical protein